MSFPSTTGTAIFFHSGRSISIISRKPTTERLRFGTSIPTACLPGIGATIRTDKKLAEKEKNVHFGGRLGQYRYYDMDKVIEAALGMAEEELGRRN